MARLAYEETDKLHNLGKPGCFTLSLCSQAECAATIEVTLTMQTALETALVSLESHKWVSLQSSAARRQKLLSPQNSDLASKASGLSPSKGEGPPYELMDHPPLAVLTNGLLSALNELRHCAPLSLSHRLAGALQVCDLTLCFSHQVHRAQNQAYRVHLFTQAMMITIRLQPCASRT